jgi:hypothetical protein
MAAAQGALRPRDDVRGRRHGCRGHRSKGCKEIMATEAQSRWCARAAAASSSRSARRTRSSPEDLTDEQRMIARRATTSWRTRWCPSSRDPRPQVRGHARALARRRASSGCSASRSRRRTAGSASTTVSRLPRLRKVGPRRQLRRQLHGSLRHRHPAHRLLRHRGSEERSTCPASPPGSGSAPTRSRRPRRPATP